MCPSNLAVIVVGAGLAGLSAVSQLISQSIPVILVEQTPKPGGNSIKASSGINGAPTKYQPVEDTLFLSDTINSAGKVLSESTGLVREQREKLMSTLTDESSKAIDWLVEEKGIDLSRVAQIGGHTLPRTHRGAGKLPPGAAIVSTLVKNATASPLFRLESSTRVTGVLKDGNEIVGVTYEREREGGDEPEKGVLNGPVIFATGGFAGDADGLLAQYRPDLAGFPSTNDPRPGCQNLLTAVGAQLLDMDLVQVHPTGFVDPKNPLARLKFLAAEILRGEGGMLLWNGGRRFVNEMETRQHVTEVIMRIAPVDTETPRQWNLQLVLDESTYEATKSHADFYLFKGLMKKTTISDIGPDALSNISTYAGIVAGRISDPYGRKDFAHWTLKEEDVTPETTVYVGRVTPVVHFTMGGVVINEKSEVLGSSSGPIPGLWAAGEVTGGIHGENRLGGSSLLECVVFGRIAGDQAAEYFQRKFGGGREL